MKQKCVQTIGPLCLRSEKSFFHTGRFRNLSLILVSSAFSSFEGRLTFGHLKFLATPTIIAAIFDLKKCPQNESTTCSHKQYRNYPAQKLNLNIVPTFDSLRASKFTENTLQKSLESRVYSV